jgi:hypothetical protein
MSGIIPPFSTTGIGSAPHNDAQEACELIAASFDIPFWPQLPHRSFRELMIPQYAEGMPFLRIDDSAEKIFIARDDSDDLDRFYEAHAELPGVAISEDHSAGIHAFIKTFSGKRFDIVKGHVTGPLTFTLGLKDSSGAPIYFDEEMREIASMLLQAKIRWQVETLKKMADNVIIFIDEPIFSAIGSSSYLGVKDDEILRLLSDSAAAIENAGGISGIHCCGKADWSMVIQSGVRILNFDAFEYFDTFAMYGDDIKAFLDAGGYLAWGVVPASDAIAAVGAEDVSALFKERLSRLQGITKSDLIYKQALITPSCGAGSRTMAEAEKIFRICRSVKESVIT